MRSARGGVGGGSHCLARRTAVVHCSSPMIDLTRIASAVVIHWVLPNILSASCAADDTTTRDMRVVSLPRTRRIERGRLRPPDLR